MSALVCGKRSQFEGISSPGASPPPTVQKRARYRSIISPSRHFTGTGGPSSTGEKLSTLRSLFPSMTEEELQRALEECGHDLDLTIKGLNLLCLAPSERGRDGSHVTGSRSHGSPEERVAAEHGANAQVEAAGDIASSPAQLGEQPQPEQAGSQGQQQQEQAEAGTRSDAVSSVLSVEWVDAVVQEMMSARDLDDARQRAARVLQTFGAAVLERAGAGKEAEAQQLRQQLLGLQRDNQILKRAVAIQHERHVAHEARDSEVNQLKQMLGQYQEQLRKLEVNNYALTLHLQKAQVGTSLPNRFHPDVF